MKQSCHASPRKPGPQAIEGGNRAALRCGDSSVVLCLHQPRELSSEGTVRGGQGVSYRGDTNRKERREGGESGGQGDDEGGWAMR